MKRFLSITCLAFQMAGAALGGVTTYSDNFDDGVRNKALWTIGNNSGAKLVETGGRLYAYSGVLNPLNDYHSITWLQKPVISLIYQDVLELEAVVKLPLLPIDFDPAASFSLNIGFLMPDTDPSQRVFLYSYRDQGGRGHNVNVFKSDATSIAHGIGSSSLARYIIKLRYNTANGSCTVWSRENSLQKWTKLTTFDLNSDWNLWPGSSVTLQAFLSFTSYKTRVNEAKYIYFDNVKVTHIRP